VSSWTLYTGFEPFGDVAYNPSWDVALSAAAVATEGHVTAALRLPVTPCAWTRIEALARDLDERCGGVDLVERRGRVVMFGVAANRKSIGVERRAVNHGSGVDNNGEELPAIVSRGAPDERSSSIDVHALARALGARASMDVEVSDDAGRYVCNWTYFKILGWSSALAHRVDAVFIHVPAITPDEAALLGRNCAHALSVEA